MGPLQERSRGPLRLLLPLLLALLLPALASAGARAATLGGIVTKQNGGERPVALAGATITAADASSGTAVATTTSDPLGGYLLTLPAGDYDVAVTAAGREPVARRGVAVSGAAQLDTTLVPTGWGRVFGTVADAGGLPVAGVTVGFLYRSGAPSTVSDASGRFSLAVAGSGDRWLELSGGPAATSWKVDVDGGATAGEQRELTISVPPMTTLTARVLGNGDSPLAGVPAQLPELRVDAPVGSGFTGTFSNELREGVTDANGEFSGQVLLHGTGFLSDVVLAVPDSDTFYWQGGVQPGSIDGPTVATLRLTRFGSLSLHIRDADGQPIDGGAWSDEGGWVYGSDVGVRRSEGAHDLTIRPKTLGNPAPWIFTSDAYPFAGAHEETLRLPAVTPSTIRVVDDNGDPVVGASVTPPVFEVVWGPSTMPGTLTVPLNRLRTTNANGEITVDTYAGMTADPGTPGLVVPPAGLGYGSEQEFTVTAVGGTTTVVVPRDLVHVDGTVFDPDGDPVADARFLVPGGFETTTLADGSFALDVPAGTAGFQLFVAGGRFDATAAVFDDDTTLTLRLPRPVRLSVEVTGDGGRPLAGANVNLVLLRAAGLDLGGGLLATGWTSERNLTTDASGTAVFPVFAGSVRYLGSRGITVTGPAGTTYLAQRPALPAFAADETVAVQLLRPDPSAAPPAEEPPAEEPRVEEPPAAEPPAAAPVIPPPAAVPPVGTPPAAVPPAPARQQQQARRAKAKARARRRSRAPHRRGHTRARQRPRRSAPAPRRAARRTRGRGTRR
ncbi:carboxypeptidase-like regulatory domain-containing protein [Conexibacter sp. JD483]|uniref:carboxypeptidase-like regulatory domain-containing protein n=1 Tax=unclassified Conexibacter TaxID=2627773 RepID=UPI0027279822|nr:MULTISPECIES: carboxypeptidase-like regulatory domain-containing protein [unclassified Conexibacter]MDO8189500.1 carboxypeptidase-like regulatory domain-containing protein [Conexibacter sp. CPCC 205706]MDO8198172.1 carboxypeptidase-like regulatory domain-containing protein [Conexibacter sp. CPCC 205762]MDR9372775.1 carboxypeptidase-like regulatory domain-containing protein [Conexibacter sp. JD483]